MDTGLRTGTAAGRWVITACVLGSGMAMLDNTVVTIALPRIAEDLGAGFAGLQWTVNGYTLTLAGLILLGGSLGDRFGRRRIFVTGAVWFALASLLCGLAPSVEVLAAARALQGVGGALLTPGSLALISASFHGADRAAAIGAWSGLGGVAGALGPFVGGTLVEWSWRAVFLINLPLAAVVVAVAVRHVPESRDPDAAHRLDVPGSVLAVAGLALLTWAGTAAGSGASPGLQVWGAGVAGVAALVAFALVERRSRSPLVPPELFTGTGDAGDGRRFTGANVVTVAVYAALGLLFVLLAVQLQIVAGFSPLLAGTATLPVTVLMLLLSARAGRLATRTGPAPLVTGGLLLAAAGMLLASRIGPGAGWFTDVLPATALVGLGLSAAVAPLTTAVLDAAADRHAGVASGVNNAIARAAGLLAVAAVPAIAGIRGDAPADPASFGPGFTVAMTIGAGLLAVGAALAAALLRGRPASPVAAPPA
ncbi:putative sugar transporter [Pseudonocardia sp. Ae406_Ps2]|nr:MULTISPECIES: MFS transporter [unclassified Pseudonocardia]OLL99837.1 putative sugar transporter [Pseudonocardia sp. Ae331_Ps2]OLM02413.1 putative sugar transporter [Pseudonocardia sp. Ae406_Ps2]OLM23984.1 putative sugar transporter [Pseudonocardia sp. Ae706_Ps2]OLM30065.1 putative sugar transporter [Pseudonocardia sp. Ae717_Ps2]